MVAQIPQPSQQPSVLLAHAGALKVNREFLRSLSVPQAKTHTPVSHALLIDHLEESLGFRQMKIVREEFAVTRTV